ncbi:response regulator transcription factor [Flavobacterium sp.]|uniref:response regulator transcription factor n=1 Tax=Flavobacterium sp. TaxID=239 RepID=UPI002B4B8295|nr:response regulator transcription factor [Flavobacterium sp.]HLP64546.1 response regulator transcription factor [Flavobacterium sp.]
MYKEERISVLLADDHSIVRHGLVLMIKEIIHEVNIFHSSTFKETLAILHKTNIDFLILDIGFPDGNSSAIISQIKSQNKNIKILIFSGMDEEIYALRYINSGANGYLNKLCSENEMREAIHTFLDEGKYISPKIKDKILDNYMSNKSINPLDQLSNREIEVARLMVKGYGNLEISTMKQLQKTTISTFKKRIYDKLNIDNLVSLVGIMNAYDEDDSLTQNR